MAAFEEGAPAEAAPVPGEKHLMLFAGRANPGLAAATAKELGIDYIGSCCGSVASHVREMARALGKVSKESRPWSLDYGNPMSAYEYYGHKGD